LASILGLLAGLARDVGSRLHVTSLRERVGVIRQPGVLRTLLVTTLWATGAYAVYTYIATFLHATAGIEGAYLSAVLFVWGLSAAIGIFAGGTLTDRLGPEPVVVLGLALTALAFGALSVSATFLSKAVADAPVMLAIVVWGLAGWAFFPAQQTRLIGVAGIRVAPIGSATLDLCRAVRARLGGRPLRSVVASALGSNDARDLRIAGAGSSARRDFIDPRR
jgi:predicted MFS family arabinose efflux permease